MVMRLNNSYKKDIRRSIWNGKKRFFSITLIAVLGVTMMCGLRAACVDLRYSADRFFDEQNLFDIRILSTLGLTDEDLEALENLDSVEAADGGYSETVYTDVEGIRKSIEIRTISTKEFNTPYLISGRLPEQDGEIAITENYKNQTGKGIGDRIFLTEEPEYLKQDAYIITGIIVDALDINSSEGALGFRSTATTDYVGYVSAGAIDGDAYTVAYLRLAGTEELNCYSEAYEEKVAQTVREIESEIKRQREQARYDEVYGEAMDEWLDGEREMKEELAKADSELSDARQELEDGRQQLEDGKQELQDAKQELIDGRQKLEDGKRELENGQAELNAKAGQAEREFANARNEIQNGYEQIESGKLELEEAYASLVYGQKQLDEGKEELTLQQAEAEEQFAQAHQVLAEKEAELESGFIRYEQGKQSFEAIKAVIQPQIDMLNRLLDSLLLPEEKKQPIREKIALLENELANKEQELNDAQQQLEDGRQQLEAAKAELEAQESAADEQFSAAWITIEEKQSEIDAGWEAYYAGMEALESSEQQLAAGEAELNAREAGAMEQIRAGRQELEIGRQELADSEQKLIDGEQKLFDGEQELAENEQKLTDGEKELADAQAEYEEEKAKAEQELADAKAEIDDIDMTKWYVQTRSSLSGYSNIKTDAKSIQAIGDIFPILFLVVAILVSLTTITRMVEEERGLIGTYKALGYNNREIRRKYLMYAALACLLGGIIGDIGGYIILPLILFIIFRVMYVLPEYAIRFDLLYGLGGILLFEAGIVGATAYACRKALKQEPAKLMRPKAPKSGSRVLLERFTFIWKRLTFLNKVTARNLFRYKKRLVMTVFGITGCTALLLCGFTIKDTISEMMPRQYKEIYQYDLMVVASEDEQENLTETLEEDAEIKDYVPVRIESVDVINAKGQEESIQMIAVPEGYTLDSYICLKNKMDEKAELENEDIFLTRNAAQILRINAGDTFSIQNLDLCRADTVLTQTVENYFGNTVYMTEKTYEELFGEYETNGALVHFSEMCEDPSEYTENLARRDGILSAVSTQAMQDEFSSAFALINMVVYVILILAAMLAFVVLFTLSNTNISERERELATIKVLGFYNNEVHSYVNKETLILTAIGILLGMPSGLALGRYLMGILEFPSIEFYIILYPQSFLFAGGITLIFALIVNFITNRTLDHIDMVEALKSVE